MYFPSLFCSRFLFLHVFASIVPHIILLVSPLTLPLYALPFSPHLCIFPDVMGGKHARMNPERARKQAFVRANLRLQSKDYTKKSFIGWDPDSVESDGHVGSGDGLDESDGSGLDGEGMDDGEGLDMEESGDAGVEF